MATLLQVLPALDKGGVERGTVDLARFLVREGHRAIVASAGGGLVHELEAAGATHLTFPLASKNPLTIWKNAARLADAIQAHGIELVHARSRAPAWSAKLAARRTGRPFVTTFHAVYGGHQHRLKRRYNAVMAEGDRVIAISDYVAQHVREVYRVGPQVLRTIYRGVDVEEFDPARVDARRVRTLSERFGVPAGKKVAILPGRVTRIKGHMLVTEAVALMERDDFVVLFVGPDTAGGGYTVELRERIKAKGLGEKIRFVGACDDMAAAIALSDVVLAPSVGPEAFGRVSVEAQAMGKPVIVTDMGGLGETLLPASTGWLVPAEDPKELAWALDLALSMPAEAGQRLKERARHWVMDNFTADRMCRQTLAVYEELLKGRP
ncbi:glycosyltransferase family 4 protein [Geminicoccus roseus]|uniref:glycosyltransferase family 4 protein n=1 Tax=Geminicoccus roseus TaxID=404900 RepID=UPI0004248565|nr:glycosyltransferase family 4 protein [Geminicoccus roseus]